MDTLSASFTWIAAVEISVDHQATSSLHISPLWTFRDVKNTLVFISTYSLSKGLPGLATGTWGLRPPRRAGGSPAIPLRQICHCLYRCGSIVFTLCDQEFTDYHDGVWILIFDWLSIKDAFELLGDHTSVLPGTYQH